MQLYLSMNTLPKLSLFSLWWPSTSLKQPCPTPSPVTLTGSQSVPSKFVVPRTVLKYDKEVLSKDWDANLLEALKFEAACFNDLENVEDWIYSTTGEDIDQDIEEAAVLAMC